MDSESEWSLRSQVEKWLGPDSGQRNRVIPFRQPEGQEAVRSRLKMRTVALYVRCFSSGTMTAAGMYSLHRTKGRGSLRVIATRLPA
jgi:hypothetical protein